MNFIKNRSVRSKLEAEWHYREWVGSPCLAHTREVSSYRCPCLQRVLGPVMDTGEPPVLLSVCSLDALWLCLHPPSHAVVFHVQVHVNLLLIEARMQAELLYALRAITRYMTWSLSSTEDYSGNDQLRYLQGESATSPGPMVDKELRNPLCHDSFSFCYFTVEIYHCQCEQWALGSFKCRAVKKSCCCQCFASWQYKMLYSCCNAASSNSPDPDASTSNHKNWSMWRKGLGSWRKLYV